MDSEHTSAPSLQRKTLDIRHTWCEKWAMHANKAMTQVNTVEIRVDHVVNLLWKLGIWIEYVENYKYLGCWVNEFCNNTKTMKYLTVAAGSSFGRIIGIYKIINKGYNSYESLHETYVLPLSSVSEMTLKPRY